MHVLKARVHNGRLILDKPTTLPEGSEVEIFVADADDDLDGPQRAALLAAIEEGLADVAARRTMTTDELKQSLEAELGNPQGWLSKVAGCVKRGDPIADLEAEHRGEVARDASRRP